MRFRSFFTRLGAPLVVAMLFGGCDAVKKGKEQSKSDRADDPLRREATLAYWNGICRIGQQMKVLEKEMGKLDELGAGKAGSMEEAAKRVKEGAETISRFRNGLRQSTDQFEKLPVMNVDPEVIEMESKLVNACIGLESTLHEIEQIMRRAGKRLDQGFGWGDVLETLFTDNPTIAREMDQIRKEAMDAIQRGDRAQEKYKNLDDEARRLRVTLTARYGVEFPSQ